MEIVKNLKVCNDSAERGVKLAGDFLDSATKETRFQNVLQVVENERKRVPDQRKKTRVEPSSWYLHMD